MIDINLLNKKGIIYNVSNENFHTTEGSFVLEESKDFESSYKIKPIKVKGRKRFVLLFFTLITLLLIGFSAYYQFFNQKKFTYWNCWTNWSWKNNNNKTTASIL